MTEKEKIIEELTEYVLQEMALSKKDLINKLLDTAPIIIEHLILIMLYPKNQELNHWKDEIKGNSSRFYKLKHNNKYPTYKDLSKDYLRTVYETIDDQLVYYIEEAYRKEYDNIGKLISIKKIDMNKMKYYIKMYFTMICQNINKDTGLVDSKLINTYLNNIIRDYNS